MSRQAFHVQVLVQIGNEAIALDNQESRKRLLQGKRRNQGRKDYKQREIYFRSIEAIATHCSGFGRIQGKGGQGGGGGVAVAS
jgi:hypothetical protein